MAPLAGETKALGVFRKSAGEISPGLHIVATPIGNARDLTLRALDVLHGVDLIAAEDTRVTSKLLAIHGIQKTLSAYNDHNGMRERPRLLKMMAEGKRVALVSDAGTPLVSDPGYKLVREALLLGLAVHAIPGPSAALTALTLAGLPTDRFLFAGFLPTRAGERANALADLKDVRASMIFFESAQRIGESLAQMAEVLGDRPAAVGRELTKLHEDVVRGTLSELASHYAGDAPRGEITIVVGPPLEQAADTARMDPLLTKALVFMPVRAAAELVAEALGITRKPVYERALALKENADE